MSVIRADLTRGHFQHYDGSNPVPAEEEPGRDLEMTSLTCSPSGIRAHKVQSAAPSTCGTAWQGKASELYYLVCVCTICFGYRKCTGPHEKTPEVQGPNPYLEAQHAWQRYWDSLGRADDLALQESAYEEGLEKQAPSWTSPPGVRSSLPVTPLVPSLAEKPEPSYRASCSVVKG